MLITGTVSDPIGCMMNESRLPLSFKGAKLSASLKICMVTFRAI